MLSIKDYGSRVRLKHVRTEEIHHGTVVDGDVDYAVIQMDDSAKIFLDDDMTLDTRYDMEIWEFIGFGRMQ